MTSEIEMSKLLLLLRVGSTTFLIGACGTAPPSSSIPPVADAGSKEVSPYGSTLSEDAGLKGICASLSPQGTGYRLTTLDAPSLGRFDGVTPTLRAVAWTDTTGRVFTANRSDASSGFDAEQVSSAPIAEPNARVGISYKGTSILIASGATLVAYARAFTGSPWTGPTEATLETVNAWLREAAGAVSDPVFGSSGQTLFFLRSTSTGSYDLCEAAWDDGAGAWARPVVRSSMISADALHRKRPTGVSWDDLTLFFWDDGRGIERAAVRSSETHEFSGFRDVGNYPEAAPNQGCTLLFYQGSDEKGFGVFNTAGKL